MEKENRVKMEYMAQFEYLKTIITTRLFGNINTLDVNHVIPADLKYNDNMSKDGNMERVRFAIMNEIADSPFDNNPIILDKLIEYFFGSEEFEGALEKFGWDIF